MIIVRFFSKRTPDGPYLPGRRRQTAKKTRSRFLATPEAEKLQQPTGGNEVRSPVKRRQAGDGVENA